jgi:large subunit GTPase 1
MRDHVEPATAIVSRIPQRVLEGVYGMKIVRNLDITDPIDRPPNAYEMLAAYCAVKGYITNGSGRWDEFRATKELLKDFTDGKLLYVTPPELDNLDHEKWFEETEVTIRQNKVFSDRIEKSHIRLATIMNEEFDSIPSSSLGDSSLIKREHKRLKSWGKKGKKLRDKNPYSEDQGTLNYVALSKNRSPALRNR